MAQWLIHLNHLIAKSCVAHWLLTVYQFCIAHIQKLFDDCYELTNAMSYAVDNYDYEMTHAHTRGSHSPNVSDSGVGLAPQIPYSISSTY